jgi:lipopolysaccharide export system protein LptC
MANITQGMAGETGAREAEPRAGAFADAGRHSRRVRRLRAAIAGFSILAVIGVVGYVVIDPFGRPAGPFSVDKIGVEGTRVTMEAPRMNGYRKDGRPYDVRAVRGVQDIRKPNLIDLSEVDAKIAMVDNSTAKITSLSGLYDASRETMLLKGDVRIRNLPAYDMRLSTADIEFKSGRLASSEPVTVVMSDGTITADSVEMGDNGHRITFEGRVKSLMQPGEHTPKATGKGKTP